MEAPRRIEAGETPHDAVSAVTKVLVAQAFALDDMFYRAAREAFSTDVPSDYHARKALKAQERCRLTFKALLALRGAASERKISNLNGQTIQALKTIFPTNSLPKRGTATASVQAQRPKRRTLKSNRWTAERRARQALAIRSWQPWRTSTGPKTQEGKARSTRNALKHGLRSKAFLEGRREDRRILARAADNLAILRRGLLAAKAGRKNPPLPRSSPPAHSIAIGPPSGSLIPSVSANYRGIAARRHAPPVRPRAPRRRWRIAS
jgi:hypothetical protein